MQARVKTVLLVPVILSTVVTGSVKAQNNRSDQRLEQEQETAEQTSAKQRVQREAQAIPDIGGVLTPKGRLVIEPELQYSHSSINRLTFRGVEILSTLQIGALSAEDIDRDTLIGTVTGRLGITNRLEMELRLPYVYRDDTMRDSIPEPTSDPAFDIVRSDTSQGLGDIELAAHYQFNRGLNGSPFYIGNLRYKSTTGEGPFDIDRDDDGIPQELATGSGFHAIEPSLTVLFPSAPAVFYGNLGYLFNLKDDVDEAISAEQRVGEVDPGDAVRVSFGMAYSINPKASFSLGYKNDFIDKTKTEFVDVKTGGSSTSETSSLNVGSLLLGYSYQLNQDTAINLNLELGVTDDAPDTTLTLRIPFGMNVF